MTAPHAQWQRLDPKSILTGGSLVVAPAVPALLIMIFSGASARGLLITGGIWIGIALLSYLDAAARWYFTRYRAGERRFELRSGRISRSHRSIPRDRIRSVDLTATVVHRILGLATVRIGTGRQGGSGEQLQLDSIDRARAERLRVQLLRGADAAEPTVDSEGVGTRTSGNDPEAAAAPTRDAVELARLKPVWLAYGALTFSLVAVVWGALGSAFSSLQELLDSTGVTGGAVAEFGSVPLWLAVAVLAVLVLLVGAVGAVLLSVEMWWGFRLTREHDSALRVRRGLLTARSISLEERRLRGVELAEPLLLRWVGAARTNAVATGLGTDADGKQPDSKALLPPAPRSEAHRVAAAVLRAPDPVNSAKLRVHPRAALRRRLNRAALAVVLVIAATAALTTAGSPSWTVWTSALVAAAFGGLLAVDSYRNLGHALDDRFLVMRCGSLLRRTVSLQRDGIIGWRVRRSVFQRFAGVITVSATTAAGSQAYSVRDVDGSDGLLLAERAVPGLLSPFLEEATQQQHDRHTPQPSYSDRYLRRRP